MYTEIYINVDLKKDIEEDVINTLKAMCKLKHNSLYLADKPTRWSYMFNSGSFCTPNTSCANLTYDDISKQYSLLGKGDIKNYESEIEEFFEWIKPHIEVDYTDKTFIGYLRYEENPEPTLIYK